MFLYHLRDFLVWGTPGEEDTNLIFSDWEREMQTNMEARVITHLWRGHSERSDHLLLGMSGK